MAVIVAIVCEVKASRQRLKPLKAIKWGAIASFIHLLLKSGVGGTRLKVEGCRPFEMLC
ncbi:MAG: hypothetical protein KME06_04800 [Kastovskya adunca ATA6-11-RM4]|nr:hypothetical protein [Kastovskya adunca ATA6-11-RM4]